METNLIFIKTYTVEEFKEQNGGQPIKVYHNPNKNTLYFRCGEITGAVSKKEIEIVKSNPVVSLVKKAETNEEFYLLHKKGKSNLNKS